MEREANRRPSVLSRSFDGADKRSRRNYQSPRLTCFGDIHVITQAIGNHSNKDGGTGRASRSKL